MAKGIYLISDAGYTQPTRVNSASATSVNKGNRTGIRADRDAIIPHAGRKQAVICTAANTANSTMATS